MSESVKVTVTSRGDHQLASTGSAWEPKIGYSRAVRVGTHIAVTGCVGIESDGSFAPTLGAQARRALTIIQATIEALGGTLENVIRTRIYVTDISKWEEVGLAHGEFFAEIRPATTMVEITKLIDGAALVEIEADAIVG